MGQVSAQRDCTEGRFFCFVDNMKQRWLYGKRGNLWKSKILLAVIFPA